MDNPTVSALTVAVKATAAKVTDARQQSVKLADDTATKVAASLTPTPSRIG